jgi:hypothetical protein
MKRHELTARCALLSWPEEWELRVIIDGKTMLAKRCTRSDDAFMLAEQWKLQLIERAWQQILPRTARAEQIGGRPSA